MIWTIDTGTCDGAGIDNIPAPKGKRMAFNSYDWQKLCDLQEKQVLELQKQLASAKAECERLNSRWTSLEGWHNAYDQQRITDLESELAAAKAECENERQMRQAEVKLVEEQAAEIRRLDKNIDDLSKQLATAKAECEQMQRQIEHRDGVIEEVCAERDNAEDEVEKLKRGTPYIDNESLKEQLATARDCVETVRLIEKHRMHIGPRVPIYEDGVNTWSAWKLGDVNISQTDTLHAAVRLAAKGGNE